MGLQLYVVDTNVDPTVVDFPIPGNDDAVKSVALIVRAVADAIEEGYKEFGNRKERKKKLKTKKKKKERRRSKGEC